MKKYYDVMYREDYDWWTLAIAFNASPDRQEELKKYEFTGVEDLEVIVTSYGERVVVEINCRLEWYGNEDYYDEFYDKEDEEETKDVGFESEDELLNLLTKIRSQLMEGDYRALYAVWEVYGNETEDDEDDEEWEAPPVPEYRPSGNSIIQQLKNMMIIP